MVPLAALFAVFQAVAGGLLRDGSMLPTIVLLPLMALAAAFSFIGARRLYLLLGLALVWVIAVGVVGSVAPPADPAPWYGKVFQVVTMATGHVPDHHPLHALPGTTPTGGPPGARGVPEVSRGRPLEDDADAGGIARSADATATILGAAETPRHLSLDEAEARVLLAAISRGASRLSGLLEICSTLRASRRAWSSRWPSRPTSAR